MSKELKEKSANSNNLGYFSYFNHKLYENPAYFQDEEELNKTTYKCQTIREDSPSSDYYGKNLIDSEDKYIPFDLLDLTPTKQCYKIEKQISLNLEKKEEEKEDNSIIKDIKEIKPEFQKYILPKSLFNINKTKEIKEEKENIKSNSSSFSSPSSSSLLVNQLNLFAESFIPKKIVAPFIIINSPSFFFNYKNKFNLENNNYNYYYNTKNEFNHNEKKKNKNKKKKKKEFIEREGDWPCYRCKNLNFAFRDKCNKCQMTKEESEKKFVEAGEELLKLADLSIYNKA